MQHEEMQVVSMEAAEGNLWEGPEARALRDQEVVIARGGREIGAPWLWMVEVLAPTASSRRTLFGIYVTEGSVSAVRTVSA